MIGTLLTKSATLCWHFILRSLHKRFRSLSLARYIKPVRDEDLDLNVDKRHVSVSCLSLNSQAINIHLANTPFQVHEATIQRFVWSFPWHFLADNVCVSVHARNFPGEETITEYTDDSQSVCAFEDETRPNDKETGDGERDQQSPLPPVANSAVLCELLSTLTELVSSAIRNASFTATRISIHVAVDEDFTFLLQCRQANCTSRYNETLGVSLEVQEVTLRRVIKTPFARAHFWDAQRISLCPLWLSSLSSPLACDLSWSDNQDAHVSVSLPSLDVSVEARQVSEVMSRLAVMQQVSEITETEARDETVDDGDSETGKDGDSETSKESENSINSGNGEEDIGRLGWLRRGIERLTGLRLSSVDDEEGFEEISSIFRESEGDGVMDEDSRSAVGMLICGSSDLREYLNRSETSEEQVSSEGLSALFRSLSSGEADWSSVYKASKCITFDVSLLALVLKVSQHETEAIRGYSMSLHQLIMTRDCVSSLSFTLLSAQASLIDDNDKAMIELNTSTSLSISTNDDLTHLKYNLQIGTVSVNLTSDALNAITLSLPFSVPTTPVPADSPINTRDTTIIELSPTCADSSSLKRPIRQEVNLICTLFHLTWTEPSAIASIEITSFANHTKLPEFTLNASIKARLHATSLGDGVTLDAGDMDKDENADPGTQLEMSDLCISRSDEDGVTVQVTRVSVRTCADSRRLALAFMTTLQRDMHVPVSPSLSAIDGSPGRNAGAYFDGRGEWRDRSLLSLESNRLLDTCIEQCSRLRLSMGCVEVAFKISDRCSALVCHFNKPQMKIVIDSTRRDVSDFSISVTIDSSTSEVKSLGRFAKIDKMVMTSKFAMVESTSSVGRLRHVDEFDCLDISLGDGQLTIDSALIALIALLVPEEKSDDLGLPSTPAKFVSSESNPTFPTVYDKSEIERRKVTQSIKQGQLLLTAFTIRIKDGDVRKVLTDTPHETLRQAKIEMTQMSLNGSDGCVKKFNGNVSVSVSLHDEQYHPLLIIRDATCNEMRLQKDAERVYKIRSLWLAVSPEACLYLRDLMETVSTVRVYQGLTLVDVLCLRKKMKDGTETETETEVRERESGIESLASERSADSEDIWSEDVFYPDLIRNMGNDARLVDDWQAHGGLKNCKNEKERFERYQKIHSIQIGQLNVNLNAQLSSIASIAQIEIHQLDYSLHAQVETDNPSTKHTINVESLTIKDRVSGSKFENVIQPYHLSCKDDLEAFYLAAPESICETEAYASKLLKVEVKFNSVLPGESNSNEYLMVRRVASQSRTNAMSTSQVSREIEVTLMISPLWLTLDFETLFQLQAYFESFRFNQRSLESVASPRDIDQEAREIILRKIIRSKWKHSDSVASLQGGDGDCSPNETREDSTSHQESAHQERLMFRSFIMSPVCLRFDSLPTSPLGRTDGLLTSLNLLNSICTLEGLDLTVPNIRLKGLMTSQELISRLIKTISAKSNRNRLVRQVARGWPMARSVLDLSSSLGGLMGEVLKQTDKDRHYGENSMEAELRSIRKLRNIFDRDDWEDHDHEQEVLFHEAESSEPDDSLSEQLFQLETTEADTLVSWRPSGHSPRDQMVAVTRKVLMWVDLQRIVSVRALVGRARINLPQTLQQSETFFRLLGLESLKLTQRIVSGCTRTLTTLEGSLSDLLLPPDNQRSARSRPTPPESHSPPAWDFIERGADHFYQPRTATEGLSDALTHIRRGWKRTIQLGQPKYTTTDPGLNLLSVQAVNTIARVLPIFLLRPVVSLSQALNSAILGARNQLDPRRHEDRRQILRAPRVWQRQ